MTAWGDDEIRARPALPDWRPVEWAFQVVPASLRASPAAQPRPGNKPATGAAAHPAQGRLLVARRQDPGAHKPPPSKAAPTAEPRFKRRDSVQHSSFGVGTVIESAVAHNGEEEVTVAFPGVGIKKLLADYLKKL